MKNNKKVELFNLADDPVEANDLGRNKAFRSNRMELLKRVAEYQSDLALLPSEGKAAHE
jgi:hypothetical protein